MDELKLPIMNDESARIEPCPYCRSKYSGSAAKGVKVYTKKITYEGKKQIGYFVGCDFCQSRGPLMASGAAAIFYWGTVTRRAEYGPKTT